MRPGAGGHTSVPTGLSVPGTPGVCGSTFPLTDRLVPDPDPVPAADSDTTSSYPHVGAVSRVPLRRRVAVRLGPSSRTGSTCEVTKRRVSKTMDDFNLTVNDQRTILKRHEILNSLKQRARGGSHSSARPGPGQRTGEPLGSSG